MKLVNPKNLIQKMQKNGWIEKYNLNTKIFH